MKATIKILHTDTFMGKLGKPITRVWCVITIEGKSFSRLFYMDAEKTGTKESQDSLLK